MLFANKTNLTDAIEPFGEIVLNEIWQQYDRPSLAVKYAAMHCLVIVMKSLPNVKEQWLDQALDACRQDKQTLKSRAGVQVIMAFLHRMDLQRMKNSAEISQKITDALTVVLNRDDRNHKSAAQALFELEGIHSELAKHKEAILKKKIYIYTYMYIYNSLSQRLSLKVQTEVQRIKEKQMTSDERFVNFAHNVQINAGNMTPEKQGTIRDNMSMKKAYYEYEKQKDNWAQLKKLVKQYDDDNSGYLESDEQFIKKKKKKEGSLVYLFYLFFVEIPGIIIFSHVCCTLFANTVLEELRAKSLINEQGLVSKDVFMAWYKEHFITLPIDSKLDKNPGEVINSKVTIVMEDKADDAPMLAKQQSRIRVLMDDEVKDAAKSSDKESSKEDAQLKRQHSQSSTQNSNKIVNPPVPQLTHNTSESARRLHRVKRKSMMMERKQIDVILDLFADSHGYIANKDLSQIWERVNDQIGNRTVQDCIKELDKTNSGRIKKQQLSKWWYDSKKTQVKVESKLRQILQTITDEDIRVAFRKVDAENTGKIHFTAFCYALEDLNIRWGIDEAKAIFTKLDEKKTKYIDFEEFKQGLFEVNGDQMESFWLRLLGKENTQEAIHGKEDLRTDAFENEDATQGPMTLEQIMPVLDNKKSDWKERLRALRDLSLHFTNDTTSPLYKNHEEFVKTMEQFKEPLALQILEMRSAVSRAACQYTAEIIMFRKEEILPFTPFLLHKLFEARRNSIKVIAESAYNCGQVLVQNVRDNSEHIVLNALITEFDTKFAVVRETILEFIGIILELIDQVYHREVYLDKIELLMNRAIADADGKVRTQAFQTLALLSFIDEPRSHKIMDDMSNAAKKRYEEVRGQTPEPQKAGKAKSKGKKKIQPKKTKEKVPEEDEVHSEDSPAENKSEPKTDETIPPTTTTPNETNTEQTGNASP
ncbi:hypothetical protein RFI_20261 [Reticulomyxa filosa]|uniref:EF-hand domain-containing protein n=1 Tax=Reticulomyxa filosa TaxID=46433 RepID=X6MVE1_RETFI|nr:hypothetical protein RFI_20261 [Reticulomyxa filosa]|eukprot:ETO17075.1 hypothetical protein RFI_20261 [Reticulomyxa filosa]